MGKKSTKKQNKRVVAKQNKRKAPKTPVVKEKVAPKEEPAQVESQPAAPSESWGARFKAECKQFWFEIKDAFKKIGKDD